MITRRLSILAAVLVASSAQADPAFEIPPVPCALLDGAYTPSAVSSVLQTSHAEPAPEGVIRTVMGGGATRLGADLGTAPLRPAARGPPHGAGISRRASRERNRAAHPNRTTGHLDMAEQLLPVIEVDAGRGAEFILNRGVSMKLADVVE